MNSFEIDGAKFVLDYRQGSMRGKSARDEFILVKTQAFINFYRAMTQRRPKSILEVGMFEGGSLVLFDKLFKPERLVGIDIRKDPIGPLEEYRASRPHVRTHYGISQDDPHLDDILKKEFPDGIDLIVDDASHQYLPSRATFLTCFPLLNGGGAYVIEDWSWSHKPHHQNSSSGWFDKPALTNLILELLLQVPLSQQIDRMTVHPNLVVIEKSRTASGSIDLTEGKKNLRGRSLPQI